MRKLPEPIDASLWSAPVRDIRTGDLKRMLDNVDPEFFPHIANRLEKEMRKRDAGS